MKWSADYAQAGKMKPENLEKCIFTKEMRGNLNLTLIQDKLVLWRRITRSLKDYESTPNLEALTASDRAL